MTLRDWPEEDRPREKLAQRGVAALSESELVAILLRTGVQGKTVLDIARELVAAGLDELACTPFHALATRPGIGPSRAATLLAAFELGRRAATPKPRQLDLSSPEAVYQYVGPKLNHLRKERFMALALNTKNKLICETLVSEGDLNSAPVHPREVFEPLIRVSAAAVVFVHNHPSGDPTPSQKDAEITERLRQVGELVGIKVLDHVVVATLGFYSFQKYGFLAYR